MTRYIPLLLLAILAVGPAQRVQANPIDVLAAMGASETQGTTHNGSWVPWMVDRGMSFGPSQSYNRAVGGSTTTTLLSGGQHTQVATRVANNGVDVAYIFIGGLDVPPVALQIIGGTLNVPTWADGVVGRIMTAVDTVLDENPQGMIVAGIPDMTLVPGAASYASLPALAAPVISAINHLNAKLKAETLARNLVFIDTAAAMRDLNAQPFVVGGVTINMTTGSSNPTHFFVDNIHPGTVGNGFFGNLMLTALNVGYGTTLAEFTDLEILTKAGIAGQYTGPTTNIDFSQYIYANPVPEPSSMVLAGMGVVGVLIAIRRRRRRA